jgi:DNA-binding NtrC family response regulator
MPFRPTILLCIDEKDQRSMVSGLITSLLPTVRLKAVDKPELSENPVVSKADAVIIDCSVNEKVEVSDLLDQVIQVQPSIITILLVPEDRSDILSLVVERDIFFYAATPVIPDETAFILKRALDKISLGNREQYRPAAKNRKAFPGFIGESSVMQTLFELITRIAEDEFSTVLIRGESGTGKELVARAIHAGSERRKNNFVPVNCAAIPDELLESELFGHMKGSFTGATQSKQGRIQYADGGTLFLDEIGDMKPSLQAKLLRVLQEKEFEPVGSLKAVPVNTRILAATHCNLEELVTEGKFREDLYYRLSVIPLTVPPLRQRSEDIPILLDEFIKRYTTKRGRQSISFTPQTLSILNEYEWKGNVRELENLVQHMSILYSGKSIHPADLPEKYTASVDLSAIAAARPEPLPKQSTMLDSSRERAELLAPIRTNSFEVDFAAGPVDFNSLINEYEKELILEAMKITAGNKKEAARMLNLKRTTLLEKIKKKELTGLWES